jgi:hypothetical protein
MGHLGLTPQSVNAMGGFRVRVARRAVRTLLDHADALAKAVPRARAGSHAGRGRQAHHESIGSDHGIAPARLRRAGPGDQRSAQARPQAPKLAKAYADLKGESRGPRPPSPTTSGPGGSRRSTLPLSPRPVRAHNRRMNREPVRARWGRRHTRHRPGRHARHALARLPAQESLHGGQLERRAPVQGPLLQRRRSALRERAAPRKSPPLSGRVRAERRTL